MRLMTILILALASPAFAADIEIPSLERMDYYLAVNGADRSGILLYKSRGNIRADWNSATAPVPPDGLLESYTQPDLDVLKVPPKYRKIVNGALVAMTQPEKDAVDAAAQAAKDAAEAARQASKGSALKGAETALMAWLKAEGVTTNSSPTLAEIEAMYVGWAALPGAAGDAKAGTYLRLLRRVELHGGTETDVFDHP